MMNALFVEWPQVTTWLLSPSKKPRVPVVLLFGDES